MKEKPKKTGMIQTYSNDNRKTHHMVAVFARFHRVPITLLTEQLHSTCVKPLSTWGHRFGVQLSSRQNVRTGYPRDGRRAGRVT